MRNEISLIYAIIIFTILMIASIGSQGSELRHVSSRDLQTIAAVATKHGLPADKMFRIAYVESRIRQDSIRVNKNNTVDIGAFQINSVHFDTTCKGLNIYTLKGNAECAAKLILMHRAKQSSDPYWLGRYHSKTPSLKKKYFYKLKSAPIAQLTSE